MEQALCGGLSGQRPIDTLTYDDFSGLIEPFYDESYETYKRCIMIAKQVMEWAHRGRAHQGQSDSLLPA